MQSICNIPSSGLALTLLFVSSWFCCLPCRVLAVCIVMLFVT